MKMNDTQKIRSKLNKIVKKTVDHKKVFGCVVNVESGDNTFSWIGSAGNINNKTPYFIASTTKLYITAILLKLRSEGQIKLKDKISKYIPIESISGIHNYKGTDYSDKITIEQLMAHTSGLPDYFEEIVAGKSLRQELSLGHDRSWDFQKVMHDVKKMKPKFKPGARKKAFYSDTNYQLLGRIIELITNKSISDAFNDLIFNPLKLKKTYLYQDINDKTPIDIYFKKQQIHVPQAMASFGPDGGIVSTAKESMIFLKSFFNGQFFQKEVIDELKQWNNIFFPLKYGTSIMLFKLPRIFSPFKSYPEFIGHSGLSGAFEWYCPEKDLYLTGTVNQLSNPDLSFKLLIKMVNSFKN
jgi:CubicO group peptidase (beta-lactamase class C family)